MWNGMLQAIVRPSLTTAMVWSAIIHGSVILAFTAWIPSPIEHTQLSGKSNVIRVVLDHVRQDLSRPPRTTQLPTATPFEKRQFISAAKTKIEKQRTGEVIAMAVAGSYPGRPQPDFKLSAHLHERRQTVDKPNPTPTPKEPPPRRVAVIQPQLRITALPQVAGTDDRTPPEFLGNRPPSYPPEAISRRLEGVVMLRLYVSEEGRVQRVELIKSSGHTILDESAVSAVSQWRGQPATRNGLPIATKEVLPVRFRLRRR